MTEEAEELRDPDKKPKPLALDAQNIVQRFNDYSTTSLKSVADGGTLDIPDALKKRGIVGAGVTHYTAWLRRELVWPRSVREQFLDQVRAWEAAGQSFTLSYENLPDDTPRPVQVDIKSATETSGLPEIALTGPGPEH